MGGPFVVWRCRLRNASAPKGQSPKRAPVWLPVFGARLVPALFGAPLVRVIVSALRDYHSSRCQFTF